MEEWEKATEYLYLSKAFNVFMRLSQSDVCNKVVEALNDEDLSIAALSRHLSLNFKPKGE